MHAPDPSDLELDALMQDKLETHCRQQLSALVDGALPPDQARFLLRRLRHDRALAGRWERWQVYGECMRGGVSQLLPADFSQRVCAAVQSERQSAAGATAAVAATRGTRPAWTRWAGGAALAASVAMAAFVVQRDPQVAVPAAGGEPLQVASSTPVAAPMMLVTDADADGAGDTPVRSPRPDAAAAGVAAAGAVLLAARETPRRTAGRTTATATRSAAPAATRAVASPVDASPQMVAVAADGEAGLPLSGRDPFGMDLPADPRPWPRAVLPGMAQGGFSVGYAGTAADAGAYEYFEPRLPAGTGQTGPQPAVRESDP